MNPDRLDDPPPNACFAPAALGDYGRDRIRRTWYDALGRVTEIRGGYNVLAGGNGNVEIKIGYTINGQVDWREDGNGNRTDYTYDGHDRLDRTTFPDASYEEYT